MKAARGWQMLLWAAAGVALAIWQAWPARHPLPPACGSRPARAAQHTPAARASPYRIVVDLGALRLRLYEGERLVAEYPVAAGRPGSPTPVGEWIIVDKVWEPGGPFGARWLGLDVPWGSYGIHGTNQPGSIGWRASAGCIRLRNEDVRDLYRRVDVGTPVIIVGPDPPFTARAVYRRGSVGPDVVVLQRRLRLAGFPIGRTDGIFGPETEQGLRDLEAYYGLRQTGQAGPDEQWLIGGPGPPAKPAS